MVLRRCHVARCTSGAGRHSSFVRRVGLLAISGRRSLRECARHLFGGGLYGIRLCSNRLSRNRFLIECRIRAVLLRRRAMMIAVCVRGRIDIGSAASTARARSGRCIRLGISAAAARLIAVPADGMRCIGHHRANDHHCHRAGEAAAKRITCHGRIQADPCKDAVRFFRYLDDGNDQYHPWQHVKAARIVGQHG